ncbi:MAG: leucine-rich repeat domain-containing protein [Dehalococcoidia bacterium]
MTAGDADLLHGQAASDTDPSRPAALDLSGRRLTALPAAPATLDALEHLDADDNRLTTLPAWIGRLARLTSLSLYANQLSELPAWIGRLTALRTLNLADNHLVSAPEEIGKLGELRMLDLGHNALAHLRRRWATSAISPFSISATTGSVASPIDRKAPPPALLQRRR